MAAVRRAWRVETGGIAPERLVFLDECGVLTNMARLRGRSPRGQRACGAVPFGHWTRLTVLGALGTGGMVAAMAVVVTNPTHYAVALAYEQGQAAPPRVVAKGVDAMAARIRGAAAEHGVPIVPNPPLARALWRLEVDTEIPAEHWQAVAEIIAYVLRLRRPRNGGGSAG